ncbi:putative NAD(P)-binding protein [Aquimarina sp. MAR_2010_214]|uniref:NAD(P)-binding protein n=1 Tax=Aquimarina sp. MAR_2010_214 TaxID=1250026 RepID=UPI000C713AB7|nr:NAD(P)-binding protein [Aquimarina sp. MAR_2010_214]PKV51399.1 putative NAD(P)-binding protein [Aquimarina sp. MAR_2010_214]
MQNTEKNKKKIAILGSGMSSLTSAYELSSYENWQDHYDITIYQMGWRLGGKTATGRGPNERIQEHGIHIAQGWYENAFRLIQDSYKECEKHDLMPNSPFKSWEDAFDREDTTLLTHFDPKTNQWIKKNIIFPSNEYIPGQGGPLPFSAIIHKAVGLIAEILFGKDPNKDNLVNMASESAKEIKTPEHHPLWGNFKPKFEAFIKDKIFKHEGEKLLNYVAELVQNMTSEGHDHTQRKEHHSMIKELLDLLSKWTAKLIDSIADHNEYFYWLAVFVEFGLVNMKGTFEDVYNSETHELDYERINDLDYREWLRNHGASERLLSSAMVRFLYTGTFHNLTGPDQQGNLAAGVGLHFLTNSAGYKGSFVWKFKAGTADTMITPIYLVLKNRGVKFKFFHKVEQVHYSDSEEIEKVSMVEQVTLKNGTYDPTYKFKDLDVWPGEPLYDQIDDQQAKALKEGQYDLEEAWCGWENVGKVSLEKGKDFDYVVLGIPIDVLGGNEGICKEIIDKNEAWQNMYNHVKSIPTMSMQLWIKPTLKELGMNLPDWGFPEGSLPNLVTYADPQYSFIDMSQVMPYEDWKGDEPGVLIYYTGSFLDPEVIPPFSDHKYPHEQLERIMRVSEQWLRDKMGWFFPNATTLEYPEGMKLSVIHDFLKNATTDYSRLKTQFFRANVNPTDRYTLSLPGSNKYRLKANESGFDNLIITGDWINFGVNVGYYEGAIVAGLQAGQVVRDKLELPSETEIFSGVKLK